MEYQKINTLFKRDKNNLIIPNVFCMPEIPYLSNMLFECTEKIDGTNIRIEITPLCDFPQTLDDISIEFKGRTDKALIPKELDAFLHTAFTKNIVLGALMSPDGKLPNEPVTIYGEGYGRKIQGCGSRYIKDSVSFILFDVKVGKWWLSREACEHIANSLHCDIVPLVGLMTINDAIEYVKKGFKSFISEDNSLDAEGLVLKTPCGFMFRNGQRIIFKVKTCDFRKLNEKLKNCPDYIQELNEHYEAVDEQRVY